MAAPSLHVAAAVTGLHMALHLTLTIMGVLVLSGDNIPNFTGPLLNLTTPVGREAVFQCGVDSLSTFKIAWLRVDTQTILTIQSHVITKNHRIWITHSENKIWYLHIRDIRESDRGWYMCQINTDPMKHQTGYLNVVVPPDILDYPTSSDMVVREGGNATFRCAATGFPDPVIAWRRENGESIRLETGRQVFSVESPELKLSNVDRLQMGPYLCIASNGVPPSVSKRILLTIHFPPGIWVSNQLVEAYEGQKVSLECYVEASPKSFNYWKNENETILITGGNYDISTSENSYKAYMKLIILSVASSDYGSYECFSKNFLGEAKGFIKLCQIPPPSTIGTTSTVATTTESEVSLVNFTLQYDKTHQLLEVHHELLVPDDPNTSKILHLRKTAKETDFYLRSEPTEENRPYFILQDDGVRFSHAASLSCFRSFYTYLFGLNLYKFIHFILCNIFACNKYCDI